MKLTENFEKKEFESKDGAAMPAAGLIQIKELAQNLQILRDKVKTDCNHIGPQITCA